MARSSDGGNELRGNRRSARLRERQARRVKRWHRQLIAEVLETRVLLDATSLLSHLGDPSIGKDPLLSKLDSNLVMLAERDAAESVVSRKDVGLNNNGSQSPLQVQPAASIIGDMVAVDAVASLDTASLSTELLDLGAEVLATYGSVVSALVPSASIAALETLGSLAFARAAASTANVGLTTSQGDPGMETDGVRNFFGSDGSGITVGVLSDSFNTSGNGSYLVDQLSGDLPGPANPLGNNLPVNVLADLAFPGASDEGRGMLQLVHDVAPAAELAFATAFAGQASFASNIIGLAAAGAETIVDDVFYFAEPMFQDGIIAQAVDAVVGAGVSYFSSAGNQARSSYEQGFRNSGIDLGLAGTGDVPAAFPLVAHDFDPGPGVDTFQTVTFPPGATSMSFQWSDPFFSASGLVGAASDLDIALFDTAGNFLFGSFDANIGGDPVEVLTVNNPGATPVSAQIALTKFAGPDPALLKYIAFRSTFGIDEFDTNSSTAFGHSNAAGASAVGAAFYLETPAFGVNPPLLEPFSSAGGTPILFDTLGNPVAPIIRQTPDIVAPDGTNTTFFGFDVEPDGFPNFFGTSAAAPHAAAAAALLLDANPGLTPAQVYATLEATAIDMGPAGFDFDSGFGLINAAAASVVVSNGVVTVNGDQDVPNQDDTFEIRRSAADPTQLEILRNGDVFGPVPISLVDQINVNGLGGNDFLIVDSTGGLINIVDGIRFDGGGGTDGLNLIQSGGPAHFSSNMNVGASPGTGESSIFGPGGFQDVFFENLEPIFDAVPAATLAINGLIIGSVLNADNAINYKRSELLGPTWGQVTIDAFEPIHFTNKDTLSIDAEAGSDEINLNNPDVPAGATPGGLKSIIIDGNDPTASDTLIVNAIEGTSFDNFRIAPSGPGTGTVDPDRGSYPPVEYAGIEKIEAVLQFSEDDGFALDGTTGDDLVTIVSGATPGRATLTGLMDRNATTEGGPFALPEITVRNNNPATGLTGIYNFFGVGGLDDFEIVGTAGNDAFDIREDVGGAGIVHAAGGQTLNFLLIDNADEITVDGRDGDDSFDITGDFPDTLHIHGGNPSASDVVNLIGASGVSETVTVAPTALEPTQQAITGLAAPVDLSGIERISYTGAGGNDTLVVNPGAGDNTVRVEHGPVSDLVISDSLPDIGFSALSVFRVTEAAPDEDHVTFNLTALDGAASYETNLSTFDTLVVEGLDGSADFYTVTNPAGGSVAVSLSGNTLTDVGSLGRLHLDGQGGDDAVTVNVDGTELVPVPITFAGGLGSDELLVFGTPSTLPEATTYRPGPEIDAGRLEYTIGGEPAMLIDFTGLEPVVDLVPAPVLTVNGTNADNAINYTDSDLDPTWGKVSVDGFEPIHFANKDNLVINAQAGSDAVHLDNPNVPAGATPGGLKLIDVDGGDPAGSDLLVVSSVAGTTEDLGYFPTAQGAGRVESDVAGRPDVVFSATEHLTLSLQEADGDEAEVDGTAGDDRWEFTPGATRDTGTFTGTMDLNNATGAGPFPMVPMSYVGASPANDFDLNTSGLGGLDSFIFNGTSGDDVIEALAAGGTIVGDLGLTNTIGGVLFTSLDLFNMGAALVRGHDGDDRFVHNGAIAVPVAYEGGDPSGSDVLDLAGAAAAGETVVIAPDGVNPTTQSITGLSGTVGASGMERISYTGAGGDDTLVVNPGPGDNTVRVDHGPASDLVTSDSLPDIGFNALATFRVVEEAPDEDHVTFNLTALDGAVSYETNLSEFDTLVVEGLDGSDDLYTVTNPAGGSVAVALGGNTLTDVGLVGRLHLDGQEGDDVVTVNVDGTELVPVPITFAGGLGSDELLVSGTPSVAVESTAYRPGPAVDAGQLEYVGGGPGMRIEFTGLEPVIDLVPSPTLVVHGTDADNAINYTESDISAAWGKISVDGFEAIHFENKDNLSILAHAGSDTVHLNNPNAPAGATPGGLKSINVDGGDPTGGSDTVVLNGTTLSDTIDYAPTAAGAAVVTGAGPIPISLASVESAVVDGQDGADSLSYTSPIGGAEITFVPGANVDSGHISADAFTAGALLPLSFANLGSGDVTFANAGGGDTDGLDVVGTGNDDDFSVDATGAVRIRKPAFLVPVTLPINTPGITFLRLLGQEGDDVFNISGAADFATGIDVQGGDPSGSDALNLNGAAGAAEAVTIAPDAGSASRQNITGLATPIDASGVELVTYSGTDANDSLSVELGPGDNVARVARGPSVGAANADLVTSDSLPDIAFAGLDEFAIDGQLGSDVVTFETWFLAGATAANYNFTGGATDALVIEGADGAGGGDDDLTVTRPAAGSVAVTDGNGTGATVTASAGVGRLQLNTLGGDDFVTVNVGATNLIQGVLLSYDGGTGSDTLMVEGTPVGGVASTTYSPGPAVTEGRLVYASEGDMTIDFDNLEPVIDLVTSPTLVVNGTDADNAINYTDSDINAAWGKVSVDAFEAIHFENKVNLTLNGLAGDDTVNLNNPSTPAALTNITVNGGDPTASDVVIVNNTNVAAPITVDGLTAAGAVVTGAQTVPVSVGGAERLTLNGQAQDDPLTVETPSGAHRIVYTPGVDATRATIDIREFSGSSLLAIDYLQFDVNADLRFTNEGGEREDQLDFYATAADDEFTVLATGEVLLDERAPGSAQQTLDVTAEGVTELNLFGLEGDDLFVVEGGHPFATGVTVQGGSPSASDVLSYVGTGATVTVDLDAHTVTEGALNPVNYSGIEAIELDAGGVGPVVAATSQDDDVTVTVFDASSGTVEHGYTMNRSGQPLDEPAAPVVDYSNTGGDAVSINLAGGEDTLNVVGSAFAQIFDVDVPAATVAIDDAPNGVGNDGTVTWTNNESLGVFGLEGDDRFDVTAGAIPVFIDGGDPIGSSAGDQLVFFPAGAFVVEPGPENDEGGFVQGGAERVSWDHIEAVAAVNGGGPAKVLGTNADDDITIIARDESTHPILAALTPGVQDFTVSVNDGPDILFVDMPQLYVDALSGDDDLVLRAPAPNDAVWDVDVFIAGGPPAAPTGVGQQGDVFELETPFTQTVDYTPTGLDTATLDVVTLSSLITIAPFVCPVSGLPSSPGGVEQIVYEGLGGDDTLTMNGTPVDDEFVVDPNGGGSGSHRSDLAPTFDYSGATAVTVTGGGGGFDGLHVLGTAGPDVVTSTADIITFAGAGSATIGAAIDRVELSTFGGDDDVDLDLNVASLEKVVDVGSGNDAVDMLGSIDATIFGGVGDDTLVGTPAADTIFGGAGNDTLIGAGGDDTIYGEEGDDQFGEPAVRDTAANDPGADRFFGGSGSDVFFWDPGDGNDVIEGGAGEADILRFFGSGGDETFNVFANLADPSRAVLFRSLGSITIDMAGVDEIDVAGGPGNDRYVAGRANDGDAGDDIAPTTPYVDPTATLSDLSTTEVRVVNFDGVSGSDLFFVDGRPADDDLVISVESAATGTVRVAGLPYDVRVLGASTADRLTVRGNEGDDVIKSVNPTGGGALNVEDVVAITLAGGSGDDRLSADAVLIGGIGDDFLQGGAENDSLFGNQGEDTMVGGGGADSYDGGSGFDTILIRGTSGADTIDVRQQSATTLEYIVTDQFGTAVENATLAAGTADTIADVEEAEVEARAGADTIRLAIADPLHTDADAANALRMTVHGGDDGEFDRLGVIDVATADLSILRQNFDITAGTVEIGPAIPAAVANGEAFLHVFSGIEYVQVLADTLISGGSPTDIESDTIPNRLVVFKDDVGEANNDRRNATHLGAGATVNIDPTIDPGPGAFGLPADTDWYRIEALHTGTIDFQVIFEQVGPIGARPGLPGSGDLNIRAFDADGDEITTFTTSDDDTDNERTRIPAVQGEIYYFQVFGDTGAINAYDITAINLPAVTPFDLELDDQPIGDPPPANSDTGRNHNDNVTRDNTPTIILRLDDAFFLNDLPGNDAVGSPLGDEFIPIEFRAPGQLTQPGFAIAIFDEGDTPGGPAVEEPQTPLGFATMVEPGVYQFTTPTLADGSHFLTARVQMIDPADPEQTGFGPRSGSLEIFVDTVIPPASFGLPGDADDGVIADSDTSVIPNPDTNIDRITSDRTPTLWGLAEANAIVKAFVDANGNGVLDAADVFIGQNTAIPIDGTAQEPNGFWTIESVVNFNDPDIFNIPPGLPDGLRTVFVTAEDVAGNLNAAAGAADTLRIFLDATGPVIDEIYTPADPAYNLFGVKNIDGTTQPTPRVDSIAIDFFDLPARVAPEFLIDALKEDIAIDPGHFRLVGDETGAVVIEAITIDQATPVAGQRAEATITLGFREPLLDDRYTLFISDSIVDIAGNALDGESNAVEPNAEPDFVGAGASTGDGVPGGAFAARFTIDSRPEIGSWGQGNIWVDINGNYFFDPAPDDNDIENRDFVYKFAEASDAIFAGNFGNKIAPASGFEKLGAYGAFSGVYQFVLDTNDDGVADFVSNMPPTFQVNLLPVAGNFDGNAANGDEIGGFDGQFWYLDRDGDNTIELNERFATDMDGIPVVGDFNGDGVDDIAVFNNDSGTFSFDTDGDLLADDQIEFGFTGFGDKPVAGDLNLDEVDDIGIWIPGRDGVSPDDAAEYHFLISDRNNPGRDPAIAPSALFNRYSPEPIGNDLYGQFGADFALPVFGNFDPPTEPTLPVPIPSLTNGLNPLDVDENGEVQPIDALIVINALSRQNGNALGENPLRLHALVGGRKLDTTGDAEITPLDALRVINHLNRISAPGAPEAEAADLAILSLVPANNDEDEDEDLLDVIAAGL